MRWLLLLLPLLGGLVVPAVARAGDRPPIQITDPRDRTYRAALQHFKPLTPGAAPLVEEVDAAISAGLDFSDLFTTLDERAFLEPVQSPALDGAPVARCENWHQIGADALVQGQVEETGDGLRVEFRLFDVARCIALVRGKRFTGRRDQAERVGHVIADEIVAAFTGRPGVADTEIAFVSTRNKDKEIFVMDADGGSQRAATHNGTISAFPGWSPDGDRVVYTSYRYRNRPWLFVVARGSVSPGRILRDLAPSTRMYRGVYGPTGKRMALVMSVDGQSEIFTVGTNGKGLRRLTRNQTIDVSPSWSPDGRRIAFVSDRSGSPQVYVMDDDGGNVQRLTFNGSYNTSPDWSPDGRWIAYEARVDGGQFDIWLIDPEGRTNVPLVSHARSDEHPSWSPDSRKIAFQSTRRGKPDIYVVDINGKNVRRLTDRGENTAPAWGPYRR